MKHNLKVGLAVTAVATVMVAGAGVGTAQAAKLITSAQIKDGTITTDDLSDGVVNKLDKKGRAGADGKDGADGAQGPAGATGPAGPAGAPGTPGAAGSNGANGAPGANGLAGAVYREQVYLNGGGGSATVACANDPAVSQTYTAIAGGVQGGTVDTQEDGFAVNSSFPGRMDWDTGLPKANRLDGWIVLGNGEYTSTLKVWALCVPTTSIAVQVEELDN